VPNIGLADVSNVALVLAIATYAVAMVAYAFDFAFGKRQTSAVAPACATQAAAQAGPRPELVATAVGTGIGRGIGRGDPADRPGPAELGALPAPAPPAASPSRWPQGMWQRLGFVLTCAGLVMQLAAVATRGLSEHRIPWGNMYEFIAAITCAAVLVLVVGAVRFRAYYLGLFVLLPVVLALAVDVVAIYTPAGQLVPALQSYWIAIHVTGMIIAIGAFIFGAVAAVMYLLVARYERRTAAGQPTGAAGILDRLPGADTLDRLSYRTILFAFPAWTFAVIAGAIWADHAWGRYWGWDPKETWSFIIWLVYAAYLHARATAGWRGRRAAFIQLFGFGCVLFNLVGVNLWISGLHSYAGLPH
jgi:cytochrome c-type biogenesis protein CcsB